MKSIVSVAVAICFAMVSGVAEAQQLLTFDELSLADNSILGSVTCGVNPGFHFSSDHFHAIGPGTSSQFVDFTSNDTPHLGYESGRGFPVTMARTGGTTFSLKSLDVAEFYAITVPDRPDAQMLTITGYQSGGGIVTHSFFLDGIHDGVGGVQDFEHFVLPNTFVDLVSVVYTGHLLDGVTDGGVAVDNIEYEVAVPETLPACYVTPLPPDNPVVTITSPASGTVAGTVQIAATATDNVGVVGVQFKIDGVAFGAEDTTAPYSISWDTTAVADGSHTITAEARDAAANFGIGSLVVNVANVPITMSPHYIEFDGQNDFLEVGDANALSFGNGTADSPMTIELWLRPDTMLTKQQLIGKWGETGNQEYKLHVASGVFRLDIRDQSRNATSSAYTTSSQTALTGSWHHLAVTYDGRGGAAAANGITIYVDGGAVPLTRINAGSYEAMENLASPIRIGHESVNYKQFDGGLDEVRLWNVVRSPAAIAAGMTMEMTGSESGLVGYWPFNDGTGTTATDLTSGSHPASLFSGATWVAGGPMNVGPPDTTPPAITNVHVTNLTDTSVTISFDTNEVTTGWVSYVAGAVCPCTDAYSAGTGTTHSITITGLTSDTVYEFTPHAADAASNQQAGSTDTFRTLVPPPDSTAPTVTITVPTGGTVSGTIQVAASASDNVGVAGVQFKIDGAYLGPEDTTFPYAASWDTTSVADGSHVISAEARDALNNIGVATVQVTVRNTPSVLSPNYVDLDGINDSIEIADANSFSFGSGAADGPMTIELWMKPDTMLTKQQLIGKWGESANQEYKLHVATGVIRVDLRDNSQNAGVAAYTTNSQTALTGAWHHVAVTYDGRGGATAANGINIYIDGAPVAVTRQNHASYVAMENLANPLAIGRESVNWKQYDGGLDEVRLWNVARTPVQIASAMTGELIGNEAGMVGYWAFNDGSGTTAADMTAGNHAATLLNGVVWMPGGPFGAAPPDTTPPAITNVRTLNMTDTSVTIAFDTNETTTGWVSYTAAAACPCTDAFSATQGTSHAITLTGLSPDTLYQYTAKASDASSNLEVGATLSFRTLVTPPDSVAPSVTITNPVGGNVIGTITVSATATDNVGVIGVAFYIDGALLGAEVTSAPYSVSWDTTTLGDGPHTVMVSARDSLNNVGTASVIVTVRNNPVVTSPFFAAFDGVNDYLEAADANNLSFGNGAVDSALTFEAWIRPDTMTVKQQLLGKWGESTNQEYKLQIAGGVIRLDLRDNSTQATVSAYTSASQLALTGGWHHLAVTYDGRGGANAANGITLYIDGAAVAVTRINSAAYVAMESLAAPLWIGREGPSWKQFDGGMDEVRMWTVARSAAEIAATMNTTLSGAESGLVAYWQFNDGTGVTASDSSTGNHPATLTNGVLWVAGGPLP